MRWGGAYGAKLHDDGHGAGCLGGGSQVELDVDLDEWIRGAVDVPGEAPGDDSNVTDGSAAGSGDGPGDSGCTGWNPTVDFAIEELHNLRAAFGPPDVRRGDALAVGEQERVGQLRIWVGLGLIVVGGIRRRGFVFAAGANRLHAEQIHQALVILFGRKVDDGRVRRCGLLAVRKGWHEEERNEDGECGIPGSRPWLGC